MKRRRKWCLLGGAALGLVLLLALGITRFSGGDALERYMVRLRAQGEKLTFRELAPRAVSASNQSYQELVDAAAQLRPYAGIAGNILLMQPTAPDRVSPVWKQEKIPLADNSFRAWSELAAQVRQVEPHLVAVREALREPPAALAWDYQDPTQMPAIKLAEHRLAAHWLQASALSHLQAGELDKAVRDLRALIALSHVLEEDTLVLHMIRTAIAGLGLAVTWEALAAPGWTEPQLAALQHEWQEVPLLQNLDRTFALERALALAWYEHMRKEGAAGTWNQTLLGAQSSGSLPDIVTERIGPSVWQVAFSRQDVLLFLKTLQPIGASIRAAREHHSWRQLNAELTPALQTPQPSRNPLNEFRHRFTQSVLPNWQKACQSLMKTETQRQMTVTALALKRYELKHGTLPPDLRALVPAFISAVPHDYMDGQPLRYRLEAGGRYLLYSVGLDGTDDGGKAEPAEPGRKNPGLWEGKDVVWPHAVEP